VWQLILKVAWLQPIELNNKNNISKNPSLPLRHINWSGERPNLNEHRLQPAVSPSSSLQHGDRKVNLNQTWGQPLKNFIKWLVISKL
jgi:hypothetical protein